MLPKAYDPKACEDRIYAMWEESGAFAADATSTKESFSIAMPPPNATGQLHLGHTVMLAIEDILIRFHRMRGKEVLWVPGTDHAAIATENVVLKQIQKEEKIPDPRATLGREEVIRRIADFVAKSQGTIRGQIRKMGASCDWSRERYTLDPTLNRCVNDVFARMFRDGLIYRGHRIVHWDPKMQTTVSDDEIEWQEVKEPFYTLKYGPFEISTARPETKFGDKYVVMHPEDKRYAKYKHGDTFECEWINGKVTATIIKDKAVDPEFGTGVMTITPWHDMVDFEIAQHHDLQKEQIIGFDGKLLEVAGEFAGMKIADARPKIVEKLKEKGLLVKVDENYVHNVAMSYRGKGKIEPQIREQWFVDVGKKVVEWEGKKRSLKEILKHVVDAGHVEILPQHFEKTYFHWIDNLRDWCISRQIWWGHRIPVWYDEEGNAYLRDCQQFILARHGESVGNERGVVQSHGDALSKEGEKHAKQLAKALAGRHISKIVTSGSIRALKTAQIVAEELQIDQVEVWDELSQMDMGTISGLPEIPGKPAIERALEKKTGEGLDALFTRSKRAWEKMQREQSDGEILVVSHRTNLSALDAAREGRPAEHIVQKRRENEGAAFGIWSEITVEKKSLQQDPDTLDTWFSSALWTWSTLVDPEAAKDPSLTLEQILEQSPDFRKFHPTSVMETGYDILFFWVARMILMTTYAVGQVPFKTVYLHGLVRTRDGRKMSKSDPETMIDPLDIIPKYGADALRLSMIVGQSAGADSKLYEEKIAGYRNFVNKLWNASRFVLLECEKAGKTPTGIALLPPLKELSLSDRAILHASEVLIEDVTKAIDEYRLSEAGDRLYGFVWDIFCDWYLELSKGSANIAVLVHVLRRILRLLHPYCPFVTEELWSSLKPADAGMLIGEEWPAAKKERKDPKAWAQFQVLIDVISAIRKLRADQGVEPGKRVTAIIHTTKHAELLESQCEHIVRLGRLQSLQISPKTEKHPDAASAFFADVEVHLPLKDLVDLEKERENLEEEQLELAEYVKSMKTKLQNEAFTAKAPEKVVAQEKEKLAAAEEKLKKIDERLTALDSK